MFLSLITLIALTTTPTVFAGVTTSTTTGAPVGEEVCDLSTFPCGEGKYSITTETENFCFDFGEEFPEGATTKPCSEMAVTTDGDFDLSHFNDATGYFCDVTVEGGVLTSFQVSNADRKRVAVEIATVTFDECVELDFDDHMAGRKRQIPFPAASSATFGVLASGANGDPHLIGAHGEHFEFYGQPGAVYTLFSTPQFVLNMQLWDKGPEDRYIERLALVFRNVTHVFSTAAFHPKKFEQKLNRELASVGAKAKLSPYRIELELCEGQKIEIVQKVARAQKNAGDIYHLDVAVTVPGCHDSYGGALGQTYQCRYAKGERFVWTQSRKLEETFRVKSLMAKSGSFSRDAPCHDVVKEFAGQSPMSGRSGKQE